MVSVAGESPETSPKVSPTTSLATPAGTPSTTGSPDVREGPLFLYDGDCAFCTSCARFIERHIPTRAEVVPWQWTDLDALGVTQRQVDDAVQWISRSGSVAGGPVGIGRLLVDAGSFWRPLGWLLIVPPGRWLAWPVYWCIARNRHRMPGGSAACALPHAGREVSRQR